MVGWITVFHRLDIPISKNFPKFGADTQSLYGNLMKLVWLIIIGLFIGGYACTYLLSQDSRRQFLPPAGRKSVRRFGITCFFIALALGLLILYVRLKR